MWNAAAGELVDWVASRGSAGASIAETLHFIFGMPAQRPAASSPFDHLYLVNMHLMRAALLSLPPTCITTRDLTTPSSCLASRYAQLPLHDVATGVMPLLQLITAGGACAAEALSEEDTLQRREWLRMRAIIADGPDAVPTFRSRGERLGGEDGCIPDGVLEEDIGAWLSAYMASAASAPHSQVAESIWLDAPNATPSSSLTALRDRGVSSTFALRLHRTVLYCTSPTDEIRVLLASQTLLADLYLTALRAVAALGAVGLDRAVFTRLTSQQALARLKGAGVIVVAWSLPTTAMLSSSSQDAAAAVAGGDPKALLRYGLRRGSLYRVFCTHAGPEARYASVANRGAQSLRTRIDLVAPRVPFGLEQMSSPTLLYFPPLAVVAPLALRCVQLTGRRVVGAAAEGHAGAVVWQCQPRALTLALSAEVTPIAANKDITAQKPEYRARLRIAHASILLLDEMLRSQGHGSAHYDSVDAMFVVSLVGAAVDSAGAEGYEGIIITLHDDAPTPPLTSPQRGSSLIKSEEGVDDSAALHDEMQREATTDGEDGRNADGRPSSAQLALNAHTATWPADLELDPFRDPFPQVAEYLATHPSYAMPLRLLHATLGLDPSMSRAAERVIAASSSRVEVKSASCAKSRAQFHVLVASEGNAAVGVKKEAQFDSRRTVVVDRLAQAVLEVIRSDDVPAVLALPHLHLLIPEEQRPDLKPLRNAVLRLTAAGDVAVGNHRVDKRNILMVSRNPRALVTADAKEAAWKQWCDFVSLRRSQAVRKRVSAMPKKRSVVKRSDSSGDDTTSSTTSSTRSSSSSSSSDSSSGDDGNESAAESEASTTESALWARAIEAELLGGLEQPRSGSEGGSDGLSSSSSDSDTRPWRKKKNRRHKRRNHYDVKLTDTLNAFRAGLAGKRRDRLLEIHLSLWYTYISNRQADFHHHHHHSPPGAAGGGGPRRTVALNRALSDMPLRTVISALGVPTDVEVELDPDDLECPMHALRPSLANVFLTPFATDLVCRLANAVRELEKWGYVRVHDDPSIVVVELLVRNADSDDDATAPVWFINDGEGATKLSLFSDILAAHAASYASRDDAPLGKMSERNSALVECVLAATPAPSVAVLQKFASVSALSAFLLLRYAYEIAPLRCLPPPPRDDRVKVESVASQPSQANTCDSASQRPATGWAVRRFATAVQLELERDSDSRLESQLAQLHDDVPFSQAAVPPPSTAQRDVDTQPHSPGASLLSPQRDTAARTRAQKPRNAAVSVDSQVETAVTVIRAWASGTPATAAEGGLRRYANADVLAYCHAIRDAMRSDAVGEDLSRTLLRDELRTHDDGSILPRLLRMGAGDVRPFAMDTPGTVKVLRRDANDDRGALAETASSSPSSPPLSVESLLIHAAGQTFRSLHLTPEARYSKELNQQAFAAFSQLPSHTAPVISIAKERAMAEGFLCPKNTNDFIAARLVPLQRGFGDPLRALPSAVSNADDPRFNVKAAAEAAFAVVDGITRNAVNPWAALDGNGWLESDPTRFTAPVAPQLHPTVPVARLVQEAPQGKDAFLPYNPTAAAAASTAAEVGARVIWWSDSVLGTLWEDGAHPVWNRRPGVRRRLQSAEGLPPLPVGSEPFDAATVSEVQRVAEEWRLEEPSKRRPGHHAEGADGKPIHVVNVGSRSQRAECIAANALVAAQRAVLADGSTQRVAVVCVDGSAAFDSVADSLRVYPRRQAGAPAPRGATLRPLPAALGTTLRNEINSAHRGAHKRNALFSAAPIGRDDPPLLKVLAADLVDVNLTQAEPPSAPNNRSALRELCGSVNKPLLGAIAAKAYNHLAESPGLSFAQLAALFNVPQWFSELDLRRVLASLVASGCVVEHPVLGYSAVGPLYDTYEVTDL